MGSAKSQKTTGRGTAPQQAAEEVLIHQTRETSTRIWHPPMTSRLVFYSSRTKAMSRTYCHNSTSMSRKTIKPGTGAQRLPQLPKWIPKAINYIPNTAKKSNAPSTLQVGPQEQCTCNHEDLPKDIFSQPQITLAKYTPHQGPHLALNTVPHQGWIYSRNLDDQITDTTDGYGIDGQT